MKQTAHLKSLDRCVPGKPWQPFISIPPGSLTACEMPACPAMAPDPWWVMHPSTLSALFYNRAHAACMSVLPCSSFCWVLPSFWLFTSSCHWTFRNPVRWASDLFSLGSRPSREPLALTRLGFPNGHGPFRSHSFRPEFQPHLGPAGPQFSQVCHFNPSEGTKWPILGVFISICLITNSVHLFIGRLHIFFGEVTVAMFCQFFL